MKKNQQGYAKYVEKHKVTLLFSTFLCMLHFYAHNLLPWKQFEISPVKYHIQVVKKKHIINCTSCTNMCEKTLHTQNT